MRPLPLVRNYPLEGKVILPHRARAARDGPLVQIVVGGDSGYIRDECLFVTGSSL